MDQNKPLKRLKEYFMDISKSHD